MTAKYITHIELFDGLFKLVIVLVEFGLSLIQKVVRFLFKQQQNCAESV